MIALLLMGRVGMARNENQRSTTVRLADPAAPTVLVANSSFPERMHRYQMGQKLGGGGMGVVYRYYDPALDRFVAVKALPGEFSRDAERAPTALAEAAAGQTHSKNRRACG